MNSSLEDEKYLNADNDFIKKHIRKFFRKGLYKSNDYEKYDKYFIKESCFQDVLKDIKQQNDDDIFLKKKTIRSFVEKYLYCFVKLQNKRFVSNLFKSGLYFTDLRIDDSSSLSFKCFIKGFTMRPFIDFEMNYKNFIRFFMNDSLIDKIAKYKKDVEKKDFNIYSISSEDIVDCNFKDVICLERLIIKDDKGQETKIKIINNFSRDFFSILNGIGILKHRCDVKLKDFRFYEKTGIINADEIIYKIHNTTSNVDTMIDIIEKEILDQLSSFERILYEPTKARHYFSDDKGRDCYVVNEPTFDTNEKKFKELFNIKYLYDLEDFRSFNCFFKGYDDKGYLNVEISLKYSSYEEIESIKKENN